MGKDGELLRAALGEVQTLRKTDFRGSDKLVNELLKSYPPDPSIADLLWADLPEDAAVQDIADLLSLWLWRNNDNGSSIMRAVERWIEEGSNHKKIEVALHLEAYPFLDDAVRIAKLLEVARRFPGLANRCEEMITQSEIWKKRNARGDTDV